MEVIQDSLFGKMSPEHSAVMGGQISRPSSRSSQGSQTRQLPMCLFLKRNGQNQELYWEMDGVLPGVYTMLNFGECPSEERESHLWQILEANPLPKYSLSQRACQGILNRAAKRGKILPSALEQALIRQANALTPGMFNQNISNQKTELPNHFMQENAEVVGENPTSCSAISFQERSGKPGGGKGILIQDDHVGALSTVNNQMVYKMSSFDSEGMKSDNPYVGISEADVAKTLDLNGGNPAYNQGGMMVVSVLNDQGGSQMNVSEDVVGTLRAEEHGHQPLVFDPSVHHGYKKYDDVSETVRARYGTGGGNQPLVVSNPNTAKTIYGEDITPTLLSRCETATGNTQDGLIVVQESKPICMDVGFFTSHEDQAGTLLARQYKDPPITYQDKTGALMASGYDKLGTQEASNDMYIVNNTVRRLTPMECERLQGFPDGWTDIPGATDSKRYKALGNSIALPFWEHLAKRFVEIGKVQNIGSLFDGIGGFPLVFQRAGAETKWTSEIEPFCEDVVRYHVESEDLW